MLVSADVLGSESFFASVANMETVCCVSPRVKIALREIGAEAPSPVIRSLASSGRPGDARLYPLRPQATKTLGQRIFTNKVTSGRGGIRPGIDPKATVAVPARSEACGPLKGLAITAPRKAAIAAS